MQASKRAYCRIKDTQMKLKDKTPTLALLGIMVAAAFILSYLESLLPSISGIPGVKAGLANIPTLLVLYTQGPAGAALVSIARIILAGLTFNGLSAMLFSLAGAVVSLIFMTVLKMIGSFSITAVSVAGGVCHNIGQLAASCVMIGMPILYYLPVLIVSGAVAGALVGVITTLTLKHLRSSIKEG